MLSCHLSEGEWSPGAWVCGWGRQSESWPQRFGLLLSNQIEAECFSVSPPYNLPVSDSVFLPLPSCSLLVLRADCKLLCLSSFQTHCPGRIREGNDPDSGPSSILCPWGRGRKRKRAYQISKRQNQKAAVSTAAWG